MATVLIVAPVFALIAAGYASVLFRFVSEGAHKGISEFALVMQPLKIQGGTGSTVSPVAVR